MLLRLLPAPQPRQAAPPTILFTLPLATAPYTAKGLPLPPNLLAHRNACAKEQVDCPNALFGDKATWIAGIVDEVTFAIKEETITILLIDGNRLVLPIERGCLKMLERVMKEVQLSFTASQNPAPKSPALSSVGMSRSGSTSSTSSSSSGMRSPSALLSALLSPIMSSSSSSSSPTASSSRRPPPPAANPARTHRRQARSLLVDAYRQFVLPHLKETFPPSFILWSLNSEAATKREEWQVIRTEVDAILSKSGLGKERESSYGSLARDARGFRSTASFDSYDSSSSASESDSTPPLTPATSIFNSEGRSSLLTCSPILSPLAHLSTLPACSLLPLPYRAGYASAVSTLATLASRLSAITKLVTSIEKESNRRRWLDSLEGSRQVEKAGRRSWSNLAWGAGRMQGFNAGLGRPARASSLRHSFTGEEESENKLVIDQERSLRGRAMDVEEDDDDDIFNSNIIVRPISPLNPSSIFSSNACDSEEIMEPMMITPPSRRRSSLGNVESIDFPSSSHSTLDRMTNRRPSLEAMESLNNYRIVSASSMDGEDEQNEDGCGLRNSILEIPPKSGESGFRVGLSIVR